MPTGPDRAPAMASDANGSAVTAEVRRWRAGGWQPAIDDRIANETPVALEFNGIAYATMLATPADLEDFARGFALTEGLVERPSEIYGVDARDTPEGIVVEVEIATARAVALRERRRAMAGRTGCGLCGVESLPQVMRPVAAVADPPQVALAAVFAAQAAMAERQSLHRQTGATHAAGLATLAGELLCVREDVGRHNALDKLIGATAGRVEPGLVVVSSRASFEMVQKTLAAGHVLLAAVSAPTSLACRMAAQHRLILLGFVRGESATVYAGAERLLPAVG
ncbi:MAG: formate dehydrogenase accessory sulfurtransferase FdhD [Pigmentiphaga sp.]